MHRLLPAVTVALVALGLTGCQSTGQAYADHAYVRLSPVKGNPAVAYFILHGGKADLTLLSVTSPVVIKTELHESMNGQGGGMAGMASMKPVAAIALPAQGKVEFAPGGKHVMLFDLNPRVKPGGTIPLVFTFANNDRIQVDAPVITVGDPVPVS